MKHRILLYIVLLISVLLCGCQTKEERELENALRYQQNAMESYERELKEYNKLKRDLERYESLVEELNNAK